MPAVASSLAEFGPRFARRLFAPAELRDCTRGGRLDATQLALRFAAKEAAIKAFDLSEAGIGWSQIEVTDCDGASARLRLHGRAAAALPRAPALEMALALWSDDELACAILVATPAPDRAAPM